LTRSEALILAAAVVIAMVAMALWLFCLVPSYA
jgi:hypothetical protein